MADQIHFPPVRAWDANGDIAPGAKAFFYESGTTTPLTVYADEGLTTPHPSPLVADAQGVFDPVYISGAILPKVTVTDVADVVLNGYPVDPAGLFSADVTGASAVAFTPSADNAATNVQAAIDNNTASAKANAADIDALEAFDATLGTAAFVDVIDEDDMSSDSPTRPPSQQSVKAYVDAATAGDGWEDWETIYDFAVDGAQSSADSSALSDSYEYRAQIINLDSGTSSYTAVNLNGASGGYNSGAIASRYLHSTTTSHVSGIVEFSNLRLANKLKTVVGHITLLGSAIADDSVGVYAATAGMSNIVFMMGADEKIDNIRFERNAGNWSEGQIIIQRRAV